MLQASFNHGGGLVGGQSLSVAWMGFDFLYPDEGTGTARSYAHPGVVSNFISPNIPVVCWGTDHQTIEQGGRGANLWDKQALRMVPGELYSEDHYLHDPSYLCPGHPYCINTWHTRHHSRNSRFGGRRSLVGTGVLDIAIDSKLGCALVDPENNPHDTDPIVCCELPRGSLVLTHCAGGLNPRLCR